MKLVNMVVEEISVVDEGSNLRKWVLFKRKGGKRIMGRISLDNFLKDLKAEKYGVEDVEEYVKLMQTEVDELSKLKVCEKCGGAVEHLCKVCDKDRLEPPSDEAALKVGKEILEGVKGVGGKLDKLAESIKTAAGQPDVGKIREEIRSEIEKEYATSISDMMEEMKKLREALSPENLVKLVQSAVEGEAE